MVNAQVSVSSQSVKAQIAALTVAGAVKVFREMTSGAETDRAQFALGDVDVLLVTRLKRLTRSILDLLHTLKAVADKGAGFRSLAEFERELIKARTGEGTAGLRSSFPISTLICR